MRKTCIGLVVLMLAGASYGETVTTGVLTGAAEFPPNGSPGTGATTVTYNATTHMLNVQVTFSGLTALTTASHIHCCVSPNAPTPTAGVATTVPSFVGFPLGVTSGTFSSSLDLTLSSSFNPAFITAHGGTIAGAEAALATGLASGMAYLNIHTTAFPTGEIRSFLQPIPQSATAPSLSALALGLLATLLVIAGTLRARRLYRREHPGAP